MPWMSDEELERAHGKLDLLEFNLRRIFAPKPWWHVFLDRLAYCALGWQLANIIRWVVSTTLQ